MLDAFPDMCDALEEANEDELIDVVDALDVTASYTKATRRLELAETVTRRAGHQSQKIPRPSGRSLMVA